MPRAAALRLAVAAAAAVATAVVAQCPVGGSEATAAASCADVANVCGAAASNGVLWVRPPGAAQAYRAVCAPGGWTLALKVPGGSWSYSGTVWTSTTLLNEDPALVSSFTEAKLQPYLDTAVSSIRIVNVATGGALEAALPSSYASLRAALAGAAYIPLSAGRADWLQLAPPYFVSGVSGWPYCNYGGMNFYLPSVGPGFARFGMGFNNEADCATADYWVALGANNAPYTGTRNEYGQISTPDFLVYVQGVAPTPTVTVSASTTATPTATASQSQTATTTASATALPPVAGRVVEVRSTVCSSSVDFPNGRLSVSEVVVMSPARFNLARAATVTVSSAYPATPAGFAIDGVVDQTYPPVLRAGNFWSASGACTAGTPQWIRLALPQYTSADVGIAAIGVYNRGDDWCGSCQRAQLEGAQVRVYAAIGDPEAGVPPVWSATIADAAFVHLFYPGLSPSDPQFYVHNTSGVPVLTLDLPPPPYPTASATASGTASETSTSTGTATSTPTRTVTPTKTAWTVPTASSSLTRSATPTTTVSPTITSSSTATVSRTVTTTVTRSKSANATVTRSATLSGSATWTATVTAVATRSVTPSSTASRTRSATATQSTLPCPGGWTQPAGSAWCYKGFTTTATWTNANAQCASQAAALGRTGSLATVRNLAEAQYVFDQRCGIGGDPWIGLNDRAVEAFSSRSCCWEWVSGADPSWIRSTGYGWLSAEPNSQGDEDCVQTGNDYPCASAVSSCCEMSAISPTPTSSWTASSSVTTTGSSTASTSSTCTPSSTGTPTASVGSSGTPTRSMSASTTPSPSQSELYSELCPDTPGGSLSAWQNADAWVNLQWRGVWVRPVGSASCFLAAPASLLPAAAAAGGLAYADAANACAALHPAAVPARVTSPAEAGFVVGDQCGAPSRNGFGVWTGLVASSADAAAGSVRSLTSGWGWGGLPYAAAPLPADDFLYSPAGVALWGPHEPNGDGVAVVPGADDDEACVHVTSGGQLDDVPCWVTLAGACCSVPMTTPTQTITPSITSTGTTTPSSSASVTATGSMTPTTTGTASMTPTSSSTASTSSTATATASPSSTASVTASPSSTASVTASPSSSTTPTPTPSSTITPTASTTGTASHTSSVSSTPSPSGTVSPYCEPLAWAQLRGYALDGSLLGFDAAASTLAACRVACCSAPGCTGYAMGVRASGAAVPDSCALYGNLTQLVPHYGAATGLLRAALPADVAL
jgi:hypothetical protein